MMPLSLISVKIFSNAHCFLGEALFRADRFEQFMLNEQGSALLEPLIASWQIHGVPMHRLTRHRAFSLPFFVSKRIPLASPFCACTLVQWLQRNGFTTLIIDEPLFAVWDALQMLPFAAEERYRCIAHIKKLPLSEAVLWEYVLHALVDEVLLSEPTEARAMTAIPRSADKPSKRRITDKVSGITFKKDKSRRLKKTGASALNTGHPAKKNR